jgi:hypothetical protein
VAPFAVVVFVVIPVAVMPLLLALFFSAILNTHGREELSALDGVVHHGLIGGLLLALDGE